MDYSKIYIVVPAFNEASRIKKVVDQLKSEGFVNIVVVNDGSHDETSELLKNTHIVVLNHPINLGAGAATQTGLTYCITHDADYIVTFDGDGQHDASDILPMIESLISSNADLVIGNRFLQKNDIPFLVRLYNTLANVLTFLFTFRYCGDTQSGLKVLTRKSAKYIKLRFNGYEFSTEMIRQAYHLKLKILHHPIRVYYPQHSHRKGQNLFVGLITAFNLIFTHHPKND